MTVTDIQGASAPPTRRRRSKRQDLRAWIELHAAGELQEISGAEREQEIGGIVDLYMRKMGNRAVLFDDIPGYPARPPHPRQHPHLGPAHQSHARPADRRLRRSSSSLLLAQLHEGGEEHRAGHGEVRPAAGERQRGKDVNIQKIPTPRWHEHDGGYYIGTGCMVIMKDPDTGWINYGAYRVQSHDRAWPRSCARRASTAT